MMNDKSANSSIVQGTIGALICVVMLAGCGHVTTPTEEQTGWVELFDGQSLEGWNQVNGEAPYESVDGVIRGTNIFDTPNSFLATDEEYSDFMLEFESRSIGDANSGVQFRTELAPGTWSGVVGYQLDIDPSERRWTGGIYHEGVHIWRHSMARNPDCQAAYQHGEWNAYRIEAIGSVIATWVNGVPCAHMTGDHHATGFVALQVHAIGQEEKYLGSFTEWRNLRVLTDPQPSDLMQAQRGALVEGWLDNQVSEIEIEKGWKAFEFLDGAATVDVASDGFEFVIDMQMDDAAEGYLDYSFEYDGNACEGRYAILNDAALGETRPASHLMGSSPDTHEAINLSEPGRPKRVYADGRWNRVRIVVTDDRIQHWLNSVKVVDYPRCGNLSVPTSIQAVSLNLLTDNGQIATKNAKLRTSDS
ncbi:MAG: DUF1080 domain-containing protein [Henriciella sp.]|nr:DUF1080 domain-containing protein [Henriciella sp.]